MTTWRDPWHATTRWFSSRTSCDLDLKFRLSSAIFQSSMTWTYQTRHISLCVFPNMAMNISPIHRLILVKTMYMVRLMLFSLGFWHLPLSSLIHEGASKLQKHANPMKQFAGLLYSHWNRVFCEAPALYHLESNVKKFLQEVGLYTELCKWIFQDRVYWTGILPTINNLKYEVMSRNHHFEYFVIRQYPSITNLWPPLPHQDGKEASNLARVHTLPGHCKGNWPVSIPVESEAHAKSL